MSIPPLISFLCTLTDGRTATAARRALMPSFPASLSQGSQRLTANNLLHRAGSPSPFIKSKLHIRKVDKMKYLVKVREIFEHTYLVEAESKEAAEEIVIDNSDGCDPYDDLVDTVYETREPKDDEAIEDYDECYPKVKKSWNSTDMLLDLKRQLNETII